MNPRISCFPSGANLVPSREGGQPTGPGNHWISSAELSTSFFFFFHPILTLSFSKSCFPPAQAFISLVLALSPPNHRGLPSLLVGLMTPLESPGLTLATCPSERWKVSIHFRKLKGPICPGHFSLLSGATCSECHAGSSGRHNSLLPSTLAYSLEVGG